MSALSEAIHRVVQARKEKESYILGGVLDDFPTFQREVGMVIGYKKAESILIELRSQLGEED